MTSTLNPVQGSGPMCRDCADFGPICPNDGRPCAGDAEAAAIEQDRSIARAKDSGAYGREEVARAHRLDLQYGVGQ